MPERGFQGWTHVYGSFPGRINANLTNLDIYLANTIEQTLPNAFELFGADLLVTFDANTTPAFHVSILELNAEPAIHLTGPRLGWILEELFDEIANTCVAPFFVFPKQNATHAHDAHIHPLSYVQGLAHEEDARSQRGGSKGHLRICLDIQVRGASGW
jgi:tubulin---tyrosine ligase